MKFVDLLKLIGGQVGLFTAVRHEVMIEDRKRTILFCTGGTAIKALFTCTVFFLGIGVFEGYLRKYNLRNEKFPEPKANIPTQHIYMCVLILMYKH